MSSYPWGAFRALWSWEKHVYVEHLTRLGPRGRRLRFHRAMTDDALAAHADRAFDAGAHVIGWFHDGVLRGATEIALFDAADGLEAEAAFAVERPFRHRGVGRELMRRAALHARNRGARALHVATERDNAPMLRLAEASGAVFEIVDTDVEGVLHQHPRTVFSLVLEEVEEDAGVALWGVDATVGFAHRLFAAAFGSRDAPGAD